MKFNDMFNDIPILFNDMPKYKKLLMYMQMKEIVHDEYFDINDMQDIKNLSKIGVVFACKCDDDMKKPHLERLQKRAVGSLLQYLRKAGYVVTNGNGIWNLTSDGYEVAEVYRNMVYEDCDDIAYSFWPEHFKTYELPSASTQDNSINDIVKSLEFNLVEEDLKHAKLKIAELESENAELKAKLQSANNNYAHRHNSTEYAELVDRAVRLVSDVVRSFK